MTKYYWAVWASEPDDDDPFPVEQNPNGTFYGYGRNNGEMDSEDIIILGPVEPYKK